MGTVTRTGRGRETGLRGRVHQCGGIGNGRGEVRGNTGRGDPGVGPELHLEGETMAHRIAGGGMGAPGDDLLFFCMDNMLAPLPWNNVQLLSRLLHAGRECIHPSRRPLVEDSSHDSQLLRTVDHHSYVRIQRPIRPCNHCGPHDHRLGIHAQRTEPNVNDSRAPRFTTARN